MRFAAIVRSFLVAPGEILADGRISRFAALRRGKKGRGMQHSYFGVECNIRTSRIERCPSAGDEGITICPPCTQTPILRQLFDVLDPPESEAL